MIRLDLASTTCCLLAGLLLLFPYLSTWPQLLKPLLYIATAVIPSLFLLSMCTAQEHQDQAQPTASAAAAPGDIDQRCKDTPQPPFSGFQPHTPAQSAARHAVTTPSAVDGSLTPDNSAAELYRQQEAPGTSEVRAASAPPGRGASDATDVTWHLPMALSLQIWRQNSADLPSTQAPADVSAVMPPKDPHQQDALSQPVQQPPCFSFPVCAHTDTMHCNIGPDQRVPLAAHTGSNVLLRALSAPSSSHAADDMLLLCTALSDRGVHSELPCKLPEGHQQHECSAPASPLNTSPDSPWPGSAPHEQQPQRFHRHSRHQSDELFPYTLGQSLRPRRHSDSPPRHQPAGTYASHNSPQPGAMNGDPTAHNQQQPGASQHDHYAQLDGSGELPGRLLQQQYGLLHPVFLLRGGSVLHHNMCARWPHARLSAAKSPLALSMNSSGQSVEAAPLPSATNSPLARRLSQRDTGGTPTSPALARLLSDTGCGAPLQHTTSLDRPTLRSSSSQRCPASDQQLSDKPLAPWASLQLRPVAHLLQQRLQQHGVRDHLPPWCTGHQLQRRHTISDYSGLGYSAADKLAHAPAPAQTQADCSSSS